MRTYNLNGLEKRQPAGATYKTKKVIYKPYLQDVKNRLENEVGFLVQKLDERNTQEPHIGFFAMVRVLMPIVETVAASEGREPQSLLADLGLGAPHVAWNLYRDIFLHNDELAIAAVGSLGIQSGIIFTPPDDEDLADKLTADGLNFDPFRTYRRLVGYLDTKLKALEENKEVDIIESIEYDLDSTNPEVQKIVEEIKQIHRLI